MRLTVVTSILALGQLGLAAATPQTVDLQIIDSGCRPYQSPGCCVPSLCQCRDGHFYLFNAENKKAGGTGCNPPWGFLGDTIADVGGYCC
ncbi:hypothetical protein BGZ61DRAFT_532602 [Ilyonectria robusta]|uniref:uncharacterized protein n=1 Tax=Ilyonectria robusta TaxID=1079257 RepID=UPI001E8D75FA|nr:uncharacterized protein BGZ61DRAFT_532602 [Ilyonectria robusta]KAH8694529.1 hypothetical protein BGZ61DRAFT_532602 [Ilyonectria robusta]